MHRVAQELIGPRRLLQSGEKLGVGPSAGDDVHLIEQGLLDRETRCIQDEIGIGFTAHKDSDMHPADSLPNTIKNAIRNRDGRKQCSRKALIFQTRQLVNNADHIINERY